MWGMTKSLGWQLLDMEREKLITMDEVRQRAEEIDRAGTNDESRRKLLALSVEQAVLSDGPTTVVQDTMDMFDFIDDLGDAVIRDALTVQEAITALDKWREINGV